MTIVNTDQYEHWNNEAQSWVANHDRIDRMLGVFDAALLSAAGIAPGDRILDVGCGAGSTTIMAARAAAPSGSATGIDLSSAMVDEGRRRAAAGDFDAIFIQGDAQSYEFPESDYAAVISRFGVMFFGDPTAAFANLARATHAGGRLAFVSWQPLMAQEWMLVMGAAVMPHLRTPPSMPGEGPGMFGLSDPDLIRSVLSGAGWAEIGIEDRRESLLLGGGGSVDEILPFFRDGMLNMVLGDADEETKDKATESLRDALAPHEAEEGVRLQGAVWLVTARR